MGINGLWGVLGDGEIVSIAHLATEHLARHGRPLRIAVDAAGWRFKNLTEYQVAAIREKEPRANPVKKAILHRCIRLMQLGIQLIFVFDGPRRPWKHGKSSGGAQKVREKAALLRRVLNVMRIPHNEAPGEAEAECAALQVAGIVDAVWSDDGDSLMFGCTTLIRDYRKDGKQTAKSTTEVRLYKSDRIMRDYKLDKAGLILFVILCGGDYDTEGLPHCGPKAALKVAQRGFGDGLCAAESAYELTMWRQRLQDFFSSQTSNQAIHVPHNFPRDLVLRNYRYPVVSSSQDLSTFMDIATHRWDRDIEEPRLRAVLTELFNFQDTGYMRHIEPIFFVRSLMQTKAEQRDVNKCYKVSLVKQRNVHVATSLMLKVRFLPRRAMLFSTDTAADIEERIECETLAYILRQGLPDDCLITPAAKPSKKRASGQAGDKTSAEVRTKAPRKRKVSADATMEATLKRKRTKQDDRDTTARDGLSKPFRGRPSKAKSFRTNFRLQPNNDAGPLLLGATSQDSSRSASPGSHDSLALARYYSPSHPPVQRETANTASNLAGAPQSTSHQRLAIPRVVHMLSDYVPKGKGNANGEGDPDEDVPPGSDLLRHPSISKVQGTIPSKTGSAFAGPGRRLGSFDAVGKERPASQAKRVVGTRRSK